MFRYTIANRITEAPLPFAVKSWLFRRVWPNPYNEAENEDEAIFIHIPKNAGSAVKSHLGLENDGHKRAIWYKMYHPQKFERYFKFSVVRNPWSRLVSAYFYLKQGRGHETTMKWVRRNLSRYKSFREFVLDLRHPDKRKRILSWVHFMPQYKWITDENGENCINCIVRIERMKKYKKVKSYYDKKGDLEKENQSEHKEYRSHYDEETRQIAKNVYKKDVNMLEYSY